MLLVMARRTLDGENSLMLFVLPTARAVTFAVRLAGAEQRPERGVERRTGAPIARFGCVLDSILRYCKDQVL